MKTLITTIIFLTTSAFAIGLDTTWTTSLKKMVNINCNADEGYLCADLCENYNSCSIEEDYCRNCAGDNLFLKYVFKELGGRIQNGGNEIDLDTFIDFIKTRSFASLTSKSIFNFIDKYNSFSTKEKFRALCPAPTEYPIVFLELNPISRAPEKIKYVACSNNEKKIEIYNLRKIFEVEVN